MGGAQAVAHVPLGKKWVGLFVDTAESRPGFVVQQRLPPFVYPSACVWGGTAGGGLAPPTALSLASCHVGPAGARQIAKLLTAGRPPLTDIARRAPVPMEPSPSAPPLNGTPTPPGGMGGAGAVPSCADGFLQDAFRFGGSYSALAERPGMLCAYGGFRMAAAPPPSTEFLCGLRSEGLRAPASAPVQPPLHFIGPPPS